MKEAKHKIDMRRYFVKRTLLLLGILAGLTGALAAAGVSVFAVSTYDTDYLMVKQTALERAERALSAAGYTIA